jgi:hypothetical protein
LANDRVELNMEKGLEKVAAVQDKAQARRWRSELRHGPVSRSIKTRQSDLSNRNIPFL